VPGVFISYSRRDRDFVQRLQAAFAERGYDVWVDLEDIPPSAQWLEEIHAGITRSDGIVFVISPDSVASEVCLQEIQHAAERNKRIVPVVHREPGTAQVPELLAALNWVFLRDGDDFDAGVQTLVTALETDLDHVRTHTRLGVEAERWEASGRERSQLLRGTELKAAETWLVGAGDKKPGATQLQSEFLLASRQAATRRGRALIGGVSLALVVSIAGLVVALIQRSDAISATHAKQAQLDDSQAQASFTSAPPDPQLGVQDAVAAIGFARNSDTELTLREALAQSHLRDAFVFPTGGTQVGALWSPDGTRLLVVSAGLSARIYRLGTNRAPVVLPAPPFPQGAAWDARGDRVLIDGAHPAVYDAGSGHLIARLPGVAFSGALSSDGTRAATTGFDSVGHVWDVASGRQIAVFHPQLNGGVDCFAWSPDDSAIAQCDSEQVSATSTATVAGSLDVWDASTGRLLHSNHSQAVIDSVAFSPDSKRYVYTTTTVAAASTPKTTAQQQVTKEAQAAGQNGTFVDDTRTGTTVIAFPGGASAASFSPDGSEVGYAAVTDDLGYVYNFKTRLLQPLSGDTASIGSISFNSTGTDVVTASADHTARVYDASTGILLEVLADGTTVADMREAAFGVGDTGIATASTDGEVRVWAAPDPQPTAQASLAGAIAPPASANFAQNGRRIVEAGIGGGGEIVDARTLRRLAGFAAPSGYALVGAAESRDGRIVGAVALRVSAGKFTGAGIAETFDPRTGRRLATMAPPSGATLAFANLDAQGNRIVTVSPTGDAAEWDARTGRRLHVLHGSARAALAGFSPNGSILAIVHEPAIPPRFDIKTVLPPVTIDLWNARTGRLLRRLDGPNLTPLTPGIASFAPLAIAFSANSKAIALVGADANVYAWAIPTGLRINLTVPGNQFAVSVAFSHNDKMLAVGTGAAAYVWNFPHPDHPKEFLHADPTEFTPLLGYGVNVGFTRDSRTLLTVGDLAVEGWNIESRLRLFDAFIDHGAGSLDPAGTRFVTAAGDRLAVFPCDLCGGLSQLLTVAKHRVKTVVTRGQP
jgi:WD40 repeat protein